MRFKVYLQRMLEAEGEEGSFIPRGMVPREPVEYDTKQAFGEVSDIMRKLLKDTFYHGNIKMLGAGSFGVVYDVPGEPNTTIKLGTKRFSSLPDLFRDGYLAYIDTISGEVEKTQNPYLPRVHEIQIVQMNEKRTYSDAVTPIFSFALKMEKLTPLISVTFETDTDREQLYRMTERMFNMHGFDKHTWADSDDPEPYNKIEGYGIMHYIVSELQNAYASGDMRNIKDYDLKRALALISRASKRYDTKYSHLITPRTGSRRGSGADFKDDNMMFRRTPYGLQLVLTDPLA